MDSDRQIDAFGVFVGSPYTEQKGLIPVGIAAPDGLLNGQEGQRRIIDKNDPVLRRIGGQILRYAEPPRSVIRDRHIQFGHGRIFGRLCHGRYKIVSVFILTADRV